MSHIKLDDYKSAITQKEKAEEIYNKIMAGNPFNDKVVIDLGKIVAMTTQCARLIFGELYKKLGADLYYQNIELKNQSEALGVIIDMGVEHAINEK